MCTGQILQPWQRPLEIAGMAVMLPLTITGEAGAITTLGIARGRAAMVGRAVEAGVAGASELSGPGRQIFEDARIIGTKGLTQSNATEAVAQAVTNLGYETGGMVTREGVNYVLGAAAQNGMVDAVGVDASGATIRALFKLGEKGLEFVRDLGSIAAPQ